MVVVAIVGVLAALATFGVRRYLAAGKSAEAKNLVGTMARSGAAAYERLRGSADAVSLGGDAAGSEHRLCDSSTWVPAAMTSVTSRKYQPVTSEAQDFQTGDEATGWKCLRFSTGQPLSYQLNYTHNGGDWSNQLNGEYFVARAQGDTDGNGVYARFLRGGRVSSNLVTMQTEVWLENDTD